jgi:hypothetical protein
MQSETVTITINHVMESRFFNECTFSGLALGGWQVLVVSHSRFVFHTYIVDERTAKKEG